MSDSWSDRVYPHGELTQLGEKLWMVTGSLPKSPLPRNMYICQYEPNKLLIYTAVALREEAMKQLEALGSVELLLVPNSMHRLQTPDYKQRYPQARVICPQAIVGHVAKMVPVDATVEEIFPQIGQEFYAPEGLKGGEFAYGLALDDTKRALLFTDALFNLNHQPGCSGFFLKWLGSTGFFGITRLGKWLFLQDRTAFRQWLLKMSELPDVALVGVGHGEIIQDNWASRLKAAAERV